MPRILSAIVVVVGMLFAFVAITVYALESSGVAVVDTRAPDGSTRSTHVWFAEPDGELWLEAGSSENAWFADAQSEPRVALHAVDRAGEYVATVFEDAATRARIRAWLHEKYGWRDRWVGLFVDQSKSLVVRLDPAAKPVEP